MKGENVFSFSTLIEKKRQAGDDFDPVNSPSEQVAKVPPMSLSRGTDELSTGSSYSSLETEAAPRKIFLPFDPFRIADALWRHKIICIIGGVITAALGLVAGSLVLEPQYGVSAVLLRQELPDTFRASEIGEPFKPLDISIPVLTGSVMKSGYLLDRVSAQTNPRLSPKAISGNLEITTERNTGTIRINYHSKGSAEEAANVLNIYTQEVVKMTQDLEAGDATAINDLLLLQLQRCDDDLLKMDKELLNYAQEANLVDADKEITSYLSELSNMDLKMHEVRLDYETLDVKITSVEKELNNLSSAAAQLQKARGDLAQLLTRYTEENPLVITQQEMVNALESEIKNNAEKGVTYIEPGGNPIAEGLYLTRVELLSQKEMLGQQLKKFEKVREGITAKLNELPRKSIEYALLKSKRTSLEKARELLASRQREANQYVQNPLGRYRILNGPRTEDVKVDDRQSLKFSLMAGAMAGGLIMMAGFVILREVSDKRIKTPADLSRVTGLPVLVTLPQDLADTPEARQAWGLRAWTHLRSMVGHSDQALICGLLSEDGSGVHKLSNMLSDAAAWRDCSVLVITPDVPNDKTTISISDAVSKGREDADNWMAHDRGVVYVQITEDWEWNLAQRTEFQRALNLWSRHPHGVIFVHLPPTSKPETLLIAEKLPVVLWVGTGGQEPGQDLGETLGIYRKAGCHVIGAMMSGVPRLKPALLNQFATGLTLVAALLTLTFMPGQALAAETVTKQTTLEKAKAPASTTTEKKIPPVRLAPGDSVNLNMFGRMGYDRNEVFIQPDGHLTYLQADVVATGLTLDELRDSLNKALAKYHQNPRVIVTPDRFQSRKVYILGKVVKKGMVNYDRPLTLLEAVTEAGGLEIGLFEQNTVEMADLGRSFLARGGSRVEVNFSALFYQGDMTQNVLLQPDDYIYFPSANSNEVYILGNVANQGTQGLLGHSTVTSVIAQAGGFTQAAYKDRVLVIRGSLDDPKSFIVDMNDILKGKDKGFRLEPKDIVFVADKPWARVEELLDLALNAFVQGATTGYISGNIAPIITTPWLKPRIESNR